ncbi:era [Acanthosepion pharaonis]|uniref:Era n=1 Tax=Acanthosepion pharaonis TaxID=158019 RepID=A0A812AYU2_ACAPH|nr:era [Sepia pharaonis]
MLFILHPISRGSLPSQSRTEAFTLPLSFLHFNLSPPSPKSENLSQIQWANRQMQKQTIITAFPPLPSFLPFSFFPFVILSPPPSFLPPSLFLLYPSFPFLLSFSFHFVILPPPPFSFFSPSLFPFLSLFLLPAFLFLPFCYPSFFSFFPSSFPLTFLPLSSSSNLFPSFFLHSILLSFLLLLSLFSSFLPSYSLSSSPCSIPHFFLLPVLLPLLYLFLFPHFHFPSSSSHISILPPYYLPFLLPIFSPYFPSFFLLVSFILLPFLILHNLDTEMVSAPSTSLQVADMIGIIVDASNYWTCKELSANILQLLHLNSDIPSILILNKVDRIKEKETLLEMVRVLTEDHTGGIETWQDYHTRMQALRQSLKGKKGWCKFEKVFMISALTGDGVSQLRDYLLSQAVPGNWEFHSSLVTDQDPLVLAHDLLWEKLLEILPEEVPYKIQIKTQMWEVKDDHLMIILNVICKKKQHLHMIIGTKGSNIRNASEAARQAMMDAFRIDVRLKIEVTLETNT